MRFGLQLKKQQQLPCPLLFWFKSYLKTEATDHKPAAMKNHLDKWWCHLHIDMSKSILGEKLPHRAPNWWHRSYLLIYVTKKHSQYITICYTATALENKTLAHFAVEALAVSRVYLQGSSCPSFAAGSSEALQPFESDISCRSSASGRLPPLRKVVSTLFG